MIGGSFSSSGLASEAIASEVITLSLASKDDIGAFCTGIPEAAGDRELGAVGEPVTETEADSTGRDVGCGSGVESGGLEAWGSIGVMGATEENRESMTELAEPVSRNS